MTGLAVEDIFSLRRDGLTMSQIAKLHEVSLSTLYRMLRDTADASTAPYSDAYTSLERELCARFLLASVRIVPTPSIRTGTTPTLAEEDEIARIVGIRAAGEVTLTDGETLGVGCGQTVMFACQSFASRTGGALPTERLREGYAGASEMVSQRNVRIVSLSPGRAVHACSTSAPRLIAANDAATFAAFGFGTMSVTALSGPALAEPERGSFKPGYETVDLPDVNLIGLGSFGTEAATFLGRLWLDLSPSLRVLATEIVTVSERIRRHVNEEAKSGQINGSYSPLLEVLNRLEFIPLPNLFKCERCDADIDCLNKLLTRWNKCVRSMPLENLASARHTVVAASGAKKAFGIHHLLTGILRTQAKPWHVSLVTDLRAATAILDI